MDAGLTLGLFFSLLAVIRIFLIHALWNSKERVIEKNNTRETDYNFLKRYLKDWETYLWLNHNEIKRLLSIYHLKGKLSLESYNSNFSDKDYNLLKTFEELIKKTFPNSKIKNLQIENYNENDSNLKKIYKWEIDISQSFYPTFYKDDLEWDTSLEDSYLYKHLKSEMLKIFTIEDTHLLLNSIDFRNLTLSIPYFLRAKIILNKARFFCETKYKKNEELFQEPKNMVYLKVLRDSWDMDENLTYQWNLIKDFDEILLNNKSALINFFNKNKLTSINDLKSELNNELKNINFSNYNKTSNIKKAESDKIYV